MIRYRQSYPHPRPVAVECKERGWPHPDSDGRVQFVNTHFDTEAECWPYLVREAKAGVSLDARAVRGLREKLALAEQALVESALALNDVLREHEKAASVTWVDLAQLEPK